MTDIFDSKTIETLRKMPPKAAFEKAKDALYRLGPVSSSEFADVYDELVRRGVLTNAELEELTKYRGW